MYFLNIFISFPHWTWGKIRERQAVAAGTSCTRTHVCTERRRRHRTTLRTHTGTPCIMCIFFFWFSPLSFSMQQLAYSCSVDCWVGSPPSSFSYATVTDLGWRPCTRLVRRKRARTKQKKNTLFIGEKKCILFASFQCTCFPCAVPFTPRRTIRRLHHGTLSTEQKLCATYWLVSIQM